SPGNTASESLPSWRRIPAWMSGVCGSAKPSHFRRLECCFAVIRVIFILITLFWLAMNVLLWRAEYGGRPSPRSPVPPSVGWQKMLTAPDSSSLTILHHGKKIGFCHWVTSVGEELAHLTEGEVPPKGMVERMTGYRIQVEGNLALEDFTTRVRFDGNLKL